MVFVLIVAASYINGDTSVTSYVRNRQPWGIIASENYPKNYPNHDDEEYNITVDLNYGVLLFFTNFDLEGNTGCTYDWVKIEDANGGQIGDEARYCGNLAPFAVHTNTNTMIVKFHADQSNVGTGFRALWYEIHDSAGTHSIESPDYPNDYPNNLDKVYTIPSATGYGVLLYFTHFDLEASTDCQYDWVKLEDENGNPLGPEPKYCGNQAPPPVHTNTNKIIVTFHTDGSVVRTGFQAGWYEIHGSTDQNEKEIKKTNSATTTSTATTKPTTTTTPNDEK